MNVQEMHNLFDMLYQRSNTAVHGGLLPEERDLFLNIAVNQFVKDRIGEPSNKTPLGFQDTQKAFDDIKNLIKRVTLPAYVEQEEDAVFTLLPSDYVHLVEDNSIVYNTCNSWSTYSKKISTSTLHKIVIPLVNDEDLFEEFVMTFTDTSSTVIYDITDRPITVPFYSIEEKYVLINDILFYINSALSADFTIYWEHYDNEYHENSFILISNKEGEIDYECKVFASETFGSNVLNYTSYNVPDKYTKYISPNRLTKTEDIYNILNHSFSATHFESPVSTLINKRLQVYHSKKFIITATNIAYIKKPKEININLNSSCDLVDNVHFEIVDMAVQKILAVKNGATYANIQRENTLNE
jgi:hypothetical protein